MKNIVQ